MNTKIISEWARNETQALFYIRKLPHQPQKNLYIFSSLYLQDVEFSLQR